MPAVSKSRYLTQAGWDDVPHISEAVKAELLADIEPHLREARTKGVPSMGAGAIYPIGPDEIAYEPFAIPPFWPRAYALDVGWNRTAALWGALDRTTDVLHVYGEYYGAQALPVVHASAIKLRGDWIPGVIDPASRGRSQADGEQLLATYTGPSCGLKLTLAENPVEPGLQVVWERMCTGRLKVAKNLANFWDELRSYRRSHAYNKHGALVAEVVKVDDHLMDALRYLCVSGVPIMKVQQFERVKVGASGAADRTAGY